jgi:hypothetical protein
MNAKRFSLSRVFTTPGGLLPHNAQTSGTSAQFASNGVFSFAFTNQQSASFTVWTTTDLSLPLAAWTVAGAPTNNGSGLYQFATPPAQGDVQRFYRVTSP